MRKNRYFRGFFFLLLMLSCGWLPGQTYGWRANDGSGMFRQETGLLKQWPAEGPKKIFSISDLPEGYSQPVIVSDKMVVTGKRDTMDVAMLFNLKGDKLWETPYGRSWIRSYDPTRSTARVEGNRVWVTSGMAQVACLDMRSGKIVWKKDLYALYQGEEATYGYSESPLICKDLLIYTVGGKKATVVALNKQTGAEIWRSAVFDKPAYCTPTYVNHNGTEMYVNVGAKFVFAVSVDSGKLLWTIDYSHWMNPNDTNNNTNNPIYADGKIAVTSGYNHGTVLIGLSENGTSAMQLWKNEDLDAHHGNMVKVGNYLYGSTWDNNASGKWACIDWTTGKTAYVQAWESKGSIISADGLLYCYEEKNGTLALVRPNPEKFDLISSFRIEGGKGPHWAHPTIHKGVLYVRHGTILNGYAIRQNGYATLISK